MAGNSKDYPDTSSPASTPPGTSLTLLQRLREDEPNAWRTMVQLYTNLIYHWCARRGVRGEDAEDVVQEVFTAAATGLKSFRWERPGDSFRGWLCGITRNVISAHFRDANRRPQASGGTDAFRKLQEVAEPGVAATEED